EVLLGLVTKRVEGADTGECLAHVADLVIAHAAFPREQRDAKFGQAVAIGRGEADAGDDDPLVGGQLIRWVIHDKSAGGARLGSGVNRFLQMTYAKPEIGKKPNPRTYRWLTTVASGRRA